MAAYVPPLKRSYIFGGICSVSATAFIKVISLDFGREFLFWVDSALPSNNG